MGCKVSSPTPARPHPPNYLLAHLDDAPLFFSSFGFEIGKKKTKKNISGCRQESRHNRKYRRRPSYHHPTKEKETTTSPGPLAIAAAAGPRRGIVTVLFFTAAAQRTSQ